MFNRSQSVMIKFPIQSTKQNDAGEYICNAQNSFGSASDHTHVDILSAPLSDADFRYAQRVTYVGVANQSRMEIPCTVQYTSKAHQSAVKWYFNGVEIVIDNKTYNVSLIQALCGFNSF